ncbi:hypothetical protein D8I35_05325 [Corticibacter populi]|uniref:Uncharacterized protein n=1 Tax=Corticibacter populi TaxID=1550736 RepID=A0A3M6R0T6_9BURK|nr:hypothetical protein [Corticibacter populi]RMX08499.1 hypothetical protein D8I35_05325 [Corticibacter populi]RZS35812.1 hypothetical protein EV687_0891 [Corticibacter populi]
MQQIVYGMIYDRTFLQPPTQMSSPVPQNETDRLAERLTALQERDEVSRFEERLIRKGIEKLRKTDTLSADLITCDLESLLGNREAVIRTIGNIEANGHAQEAGYGKFFFSARVLQASKAHEMLRYVFPHPTRPLHRSVEQLMLVGAHRAVLRFVEQAKAENIAIKGATMIPVAMKVVSILDRLQISDEQIIRLIDEAGVVLEKHGHHRTRGMMQFIIPPGTEDDTQQGALHIEYRVTASVDEASSMTWELADRIVERCLDVDGLTVGFAGIN